MGYKEVWVDDEDLDDFDDDDLIQELEDRGYTVNETDTDLFKIRQAYLLDSPENFHKFLEKFFADNGMPV